jgi:transcriptional regulator with XRE-family HTH domain
VNNVIKAIMEAKNLTPSRFADEIGVPRPIMSHILAGRNKPSLDMVQKIARRFPELGTAWILDETILPEGISEISSEPIIKEPAPQKVATQPQPMPNQPVYQQPIPPTQPVAPVAETPATPTIMPPQQPIPFIPTTKKIEKILVFYTDKTFDEYTPNN